MGRAGSESSATLIERNSLLERRLLALRPEIAAAAQEVYEEWPGGDGWGGCAAIAEAICFLLRQHLKELTDIDIFVLDCETDPPHTLCFVELEGECFTVDIPWSLYEDYRRPRKDETHRGYMDYIWERTPNVTLSAESVVIEPARSEDDRLAVG